MIPSFRRHPRAAITAARMHVAETEKLTAHGPAAAHEVEETGEVEAGRNYMQEIGIPAYREWISFTS